MTDEDLAVIEGMIRNGDGALIGQGWLLTLVTEARRLRADAEDCPFMHASEKP